ncbi:hypothetical protein [Nitrobacter sp.]|nr:hypothetical protein [Nitrobacter sp.]
MNRLLTAFELQQRTRTELHVLFRQASQALAEARFSRSGSKAA